ncbi:hypothetical protein ACJMK2_033830 [Sinanodonta woodiana]|uniref:Uncharacterized protein n=1 Tax=Sinanodonta woodiana TaxID=1069815 RepID=A0ABD3WR37_SINWO
MKIYVMSKIGCVGENVSSLPFLINLTNGIIRLVGALDREQRSEYHLTKTASDENQNSLSLTGIVKVLDKNDNEPVCPDSIKFTAREIAPISEVVGSLGCTDADIDNNAEILYQLESSRSGTYLPFKVTPFGNVVVAVPLAYRSFEKQNTFSFSIQYKNSAYMERNSTSQDGEWKNTNITVVIEHSGCLQGWQFEALQNQILLWRDVGRLDRLTLKECQLHCSTMNHPPCNTIVMGPNTCILYEETIYTIQNFVQKRDSFAMYRKYCVTDPQSSPAIRKIQEKLPGYTSPSGEKKSDTSTMVPSHNTVSKPSSKETSIINLSLLLDVSMEIKDFLVNGGDKVHTDLWMSADILHYLVHHLDTKTIDSNYSIDFIKVVNEAMSSLLDPKNIYFWKINQKSGQGPEKIIAAYDHLSECLSNIKHDKNLSLMTEHISIYVLNINQTNVEKNLTFGLSSGGNNAVFLPQDVIKAGNIYMSFKLKSHLISIVVNPKPRNPFNTPLFLDIKMTNPAIGDSDRSCVFLNDVIRENGSRLWDHGGCSVASWNASHTRCQCNHMTNFAVLMQVKDFEIGEGEKASLEVLTIMGCCGSIAALSATLVILFWLKLRSDRFILLMNLSTAIILAQIVFLVGVDATENQALCRFIAILLHYLYMAVFALMLAEGIQLYHKLHRAFSRDINLMTYLALGWGVPLAIVIISLAIDFDGYGTQKRCWLSTERGTIWAFVGPVLTITMINIIVLVIVIRTFLGVQINARKTEREKFKSSVKAAVVLLPLLGITWVFGVLAINADTIVFQYTFALLNSLQGLFIFLFHVVFNEEVKLACGRHSSKLKPVRTSSSSEDVSELNQFRANHKTRKFLLTSLIDVKDP